MTDHTDEQTRTELREISHPLLDLNRAMWAEMEEQNRRAWANIVRPMDTSDLTASVVSDSGRPRAVDARPTPHPWSPP